MEYRVYAALLFDGESGPGLNLPRANHPRASPNRLKTGLQTNEKTLAVASDSPSTLQHFRLATSPPRNLPFDNAHSLCNTK
jgi:hypothetical protein